MSDESKAPEAPDATEIPFDANTFARLRLSADTLGLIPQSMDPTKHYRWVQNGAKAIARARLYGYAVETRKGGVRTIVEADRAGDDAIRRGDLVLMSIRRDIADAYRRAKHQRTEALLASTTAATDAKEEARKKGIRIIEDSDHAHEKMETR